MQTLARAAEVERTAAAPTLARTLSRVFGPEGSDSKALAELRTETDRMDAFNDLLVEKGCAKLDTAALLKQPATATATAAAAGPPTLVVPTADLTGLDKSILTRGY